MSINVELFLFVLLCASVGGVQGMCKHVENDDMIEYLCVGGQLSDLNDLPASTGKIRIREMDIPRINVDTFSRFGSDLWVLGCSHCGITDIEPGAFQRLNNLQQLSLDNNHLSTIRGAWFSGLDYLTYLDLNYNDINTIEDDVFKSLPSLVELRLSGNRLECLNLAAMSHLKELRRMFLTENSEFKCPNAVSAFLGNRGVHFEKDPEWSRLSADIIPVEIPDDYDIEYDESTTEMPATPLPPYRERLHPTSMTPPPNMESTSAYIPPRFHTTEEVVYRPSYSTSDWRTIPRTTTPNYEELVETTTPPYETTRGLYYPPIGPVQSTTYQSPETTQDLNQDVTTLRSWPRFPEPSSARPEFPPHRNEEERYREEPIYSAPTDPFPLAPSPDDIPQPLSYEDMDLDRDSNVYDIDWRHNDPSVTEYPPNVDKRPPEYKVPSVQPPESDPVVHQPIPYQPPEMVHPASPDNSYQAPYYEHAVTVHSPPMVVNQPQQEEITPKIIPIETTTDKPLPDCPTRNSSSSLSSQITILTVVLSVLFAINGRRDHVEGF